MEEQVYFQEGARLVSTTRVEIDGQTFAVRNIGSVKVKQAPSPILAALVFAGSVGMLFTGQVLAGLLIGAASGAWIWQQMKSRTLVLVSGGGEVVALKANDPALVERLRAAIAQAISAR